MTKHWVGWHANYDLDTPLARRLAIVQRHVEAFLASRGGSPVSVVSICSGDGRDVLGALSARTPRVSSVTGRLVEIDATLVARAQRAIDDASLTGLEVVCRDAGNTSAYIGAVPADLVLVCGVFGNISEGDIARTIAALPMLSRADASVIWTRHRRAPDMTPTIRGWFEEAGFANTSFDAVPDSYASVGVEAFVGRPIEIQPDVHLFDFLSSA